MSDTVKSFDFELLDNGPLLPLSERIRDGLWQRPNLPEQFNKAPADDLKRVHGGVLPPAGACAKRR